MSAHTPGPWTEDDGFIAGPFNKGVAELPFYSGTEGDAYFAEQDANANLICAAPDLLEACETMLFELTVMNTSARADVISAARAAIAKATGAV